MLQYKNGEDLKPGTVIKLPGFVCSTPYGFLSFTSMPLPEYVVIGPHEINFTIPEGFNASAAAVEMVDEAMEKERAEHAEKMRKLLEKKNELLQITYGGATILDPEAKE